MSFQIVYTSCQSGTLPGAGKLEFVPISEVDTTTFIRAFSEGYNQQPAFTSVAWYTIPYVSGSGQWNEDQVENDQGEYFNLNLSAVMPSDIPDVRGWCNLMKQQRFIVRVTREGQPLLLGSPEQPLRFESKFDSGADGADGRVHRITFSGVSLCKSPGYIPVF